MQKLHSAIRKNVGTYAKIVTVYAKAAFRQEKTAFRYAKNVSPHPISDIRGTVSCLAIPFSWMGISEFRIPPIKI